MKNHGRRRGLSSMREIMGVTPGLFETEFEATAFATMCGADFLLWEGDTLRILLEVFSELEAVDLIADLVDLCREDFPNVRGIRLALDVVLEALEQLSLGVVEDVIGSGEDAGDLHDVIGWYRATVDVLRKRFET
ncbi:hypothetical protein R3X27_25125 [Tropicimonas sp. TH_r6]|uniref:hypothetical protein n=1 Tax=Tropicimonas sp. TH_r6 TaxID=3082085 RepID=UPI0029552175|nr:hypothetical protein [Tropicimonas sp. TH_r6]MDV7145971.1 hypothetical protein [Tropicimonas sp. TH_r6]